MAAATYRNICFLPTGFSLARATAVAAVSATGVAIMPNLAGVAGVV